MPDEHPDLGSFATIMRGYPVFKTTDAGGRPSFALYRDLQTLEIISVAQSLDELEAFTEERLRKEAEERATVLDTLKGHEFRIALHDFHGWAVTHAAFPDLDPLGAGQDPVAALEDAIGTVASTVLYEGDEDDD